MYRKPLEEAPQGGSRADPGRLFIKKMFIKKKSSAATPIVPVLFGLK